MMRKSYMNSDVIEAAHVSEMRLLTNDITSFVDQAKDEVKRCKSDKKTVSRATRLKAKNFASRLKLADAQNDRTRDELGGLRQRYNGEYAVAITREDNKEEVDRLVSRDKEIKRMYELSDEAATMLIEATNALNVILAEFEDMEEKGEDDEDMERGATYTERTISRGNEYKFGGVTIPDEVLRSLDFDAQDLKDIARHRPLTEVFSNGELKTNSSGMAKHVFRQANHNGDSALKMNDALWQLALETRYTPTIQRDVTLTGTNNSNAAFGVNVLPFSQAPKPRALHRQLPGVKMHIANSNETIPIGTNVSTPRGDYIAENAQVSKTDYRLGNRTLTPRALHAYGTVSFQATRLDGNIAEAALLDEMMTLIEVELSRATFTGASRGIMNDTGIAVRALGTNGGNVGVNDVRRLAATVRENNAHEDLVVVVTPSVWADLLADGTNLDSGGVDLVFDPMNQMYRIAGYPLYQSNIMRTTLTKGTGTNLHELLVFSPENLEMAMFGSPMIVIDDLTSVRTRSRDVHVIQFADNTTKHRNQVGVISDIVLR